MTYSLFIKKTKRTFVSVYSLYLSAVSSTHLLDLSLSLTRIKHQDCNYRESRPFCLIEINTHI